MTAFLSSELKRCCSTIFWLSYVPHHFLMRILAIICITVPYIHHIIFDCFKTVPLLTLVSSFRLYVYVHTVTYGFFNGFFCPLIMLAAQRVSQVYSVLHHIWKFFAYYFFRHFSPSSMLCLLFLWDIYYVYNSLCIFSYKLLGSCSFFINFFSLSFKLDFYWLSSSSPTLSSAAFNPLLNLWIFNIMWYAFQF